MATYGGTRIGRQELDGELMAEAEGSLFPRALLEGDEDQALVPARLRARPAIPERERESGSHRRRGRPAGVERRAMRAGSWSPGRRGREALCAGRSTVFRHASPERWARAVARAAARWDASHVVAEANQGGAMVKSVLKAADPTTEGQAGPCIARQGRAGRAGRDPLRARARLSWRGHFPSWRRNWRGCRSAAAMRGRAGRPTGPMPASGR